MCLSQDSEMGTQGIRYDGPYGGGLHSWTDLETRGSFTTIGKDFEAAVKKAGRLRKRFKLFPKRGMGGSHGHA